jgi:predicted protein tyrosine phosphatase
MAIHSMASLDFWGNVHANSLPKYKKAILISLNGNDEEFLTPEQITTLKDSYRIDNVLSLRFDDIGGYIWESIVTRKGLDRSKFIHMTESDANQITEFIKDTDADLLIVHCHAGISRSSAIGSAIACDLDLPSSDFLELNPNIEPNPIILDIMLRALERSKTSYNIWLSSLRRKR